MSTSLPFDLGTNGMTRMIAAHLRSWLLAQPPPSPAAARRFAAIDVRLLRFCGRSLGGLMTGLPMLILTTTGRRSGRLRSTPLAYVQDGRDWIVAGGNRGAPTDPLWVENLRVHPIAQVEVDGARHVVRAAIPGDRERDDLWPWVCAVMPPVVEYERRTSRRIPVVRLRRSPADGV